MSWEGNSLLIKPDQPWKTGETVEVHLGAGARSLRILPTLSGQTWSFTVGAPSVAYLWPAYGAANIYVRGEDPIDEPVQLTHSDAGILDFIVSSDGNRITYTVPAVQGSNEIRILDMITDEDRLIYACDADALCQAPTLSPDGHWLAFERSELVEGAGGKPITNARAVWLISLQDEGVDGPVLDATHDLMAPQWSPLGELMVYDNTLKAFVLLETGNPDTPILFIPSGLGQEGTWSPQGADFVYAEIVFPEEVLGEAGIEALDFPVEEALFFSHLYKHVMNTGDVRDISPGPDVMVEDSSPTYSPDGRWLAFVRKYLDADRWTMGREVWLMEVSLGDVRKLTDDPTANFSSLSWSLDSQRLTFMRSNLDSPADMPEVWVWNMAEGEATEFIEGGYLPQWTR
jgi:Tol biopolymer transport system component